MTRSGKESYGERMTNATIEESPFWNVEDGDRITIAGDPNIYEACNVVEHDGVRGCELKVVTVSE